MSDEITDQRLLLAICGGDKQALAILYDRYAPLLMAVGVRLTRDETETEDIVHDVFIEVWKRAHTYEAARGTVRTWLVLRMRSRTVDCLRRKIKRALAAPVQDTDDPNHFDHVLLRGANPAAHAHENEIRNTVLELPTHDREVLLLSYFQGLSVNEIAESIDIPAGTVKSRLSSARKKLREVWSSEHEESP
ncbi:MAG: sigma-70 family RNA polymerase sigma factor [Bradymonadaceae bacterium]|nr:sigma-70 family RNA polymerase sigma factor [Lujinxingiaceae bacterium]